MTALHIADGMPGQTMTVAPVMTYGDLLKVVRLRIAELDVTYDTLAEVSGVSKSNLEKILANPPKKNMSVFSMFSLLGALALLPKIEHDGAQLAALQQRSQWQHVKRGGPQYRPRVSLAQALDAQRTISLISRGS
jgi:hypothetical protein